MVNTGLSEVIGSWKTMEMPAPRIFSMRPGEAVVSSSPANRTLPAAMRTGGCGSRPQYGGLWRRNRRPPQMLAGVGFSGQGKFEGTHYRRLPVSYAEDYAWIFAGIDADIIGDYGLSGGGAAGAAPPRRSAGRGLAGVEAQPGLLSRFPAVGRV
jgi:hypothetical protein